MTTMPSADTVLRETEIRPEHLMAGQSERFAADVARLLAHKETFVAARCPACDADDPQPAFTKFDLRYNLCARCETMYISPRPTPALLRMYYETSENYAYWNKYIFPASEAARREKIFRPRVDRLLEICDRYQVPRRTLVEVGAGFGTFCEEMQHRSAFERVIAVEPTPDLAQTCRKRGLTVIEKPIEQIAPHELGTADLIASFEVIEHLFDPAVFVRQCFDLLTPGGIFVASCPNGRGFDVLVLGADSNTVDAEHLNYFNPRSLSHLLERHRFEVLEVLTPGKLDAELVRNKVLQGEHEAPLDPFLQQILITEWARVGAAFQAFLAQNRLSSHMWIVGRKPASA